jgi:hypothetical protein
MQKTKWFFKSLIFLVLIVISSCNLAHIGDPPVLPIDQRLVGRWINLDTIWADSAKTQQYINTLFLKEDKTYYRGLYLKYGDSLKIIAGESNNWFVQNESYGKEIEFDYHLNGSMGTPPSNVIDSFLYQIIAGDTIELSDAYPEPGFVSWNGWIRFVKKDSLCILGNCY